jgi:hypothetical protein
MSLGNKKQIELVLNAKPMECRIPEAERDRVKEFLGTLILSVVDAQRRGTRREEGDDE